MRLALKQPAFRLWSLVEAETDLTEEQFTDAVQRRLRTGQLLLLIIGDGIQEGVEALTSYLQLHAGLHVGLALLDLSLWRGADGGLIVVPRVPMRTVLIERGIVRLDTGSARVDPPAIGSVARADAAPAQPTTSSEAEFFDKLAIKRPELVAPMRTFLTELIEMGFSPETGRTVRLLFSPTPDVSATAGYIEANGKDVRISVEGGYELIFGKRSGEPGSGRDRSGALREADCQRAHVLDTEPGVAIGQHLPDNRPSGQPKPAHELQPCLVAVGYDWLVPRGGPIQHNPFIGK